MPVYRELDDHHLVIMFLFFFCAHIKTFNTQTKIFLSPKHEKPFSKMKIKTINLAVFLFNFIVNYLELIFVS